MIALLFPGQGAQSPGMAKDLIDAFPTIRSSFDRMSAVVDMDILHHCNDISAVDQRETDVAQVVVFATSLAIYDHLFAQDASAIGIAAGHSLGHFTALAATGVIDRDKALKLVQLRGLLMKEASRATSSGMLAVSGLSLLELEAFLAENEMLSVWIANINCASQIVLSGLTDDLSVAQKLLRKLKVRVTPLNVAGAFHSPVFDSAAKTMRDHLTAIAINDPSVPVLRNRDAQLMTKAEYIRLDLETHMSARVNWDAIARKLSGQDVEHYVEVGPGRVLKGLMLNFDRSQTVLESNKPAKINAVAEQFAGQVSA